MTSLLDRFDDFIIFTRRLSEKTREVYYSEALSYLSFIAKAGKDPLDAEPEDIEAYLRKRKGEGAGERTEGRILSSLRSFYRFLISRGSGDEQNPAELVEKPRERDHLPRVISVEEVDELMASFPKDDILSFRDYAMFELIYSSGMRISEAVALDVSSYRPDEGTISVIGKRDKERLVFIGEAARDALEKCSMNVAGAIEMLEKSK